MLVEQLRKILLHNFHVVHSAVNLRNIILTAIINYSNAIIKNGRPNYMIINPLQPRITI